MDFLMGWILYMIIGVVLIAAFGFVLGFKSGKEMGTILRPTPATDYVETMHKRAERGEKDPLYLKILDAIVELTLWPLILGMMIVEYLKTCEKDQD